MTTSRVAACTHRSLDCYEGGLERMPAVSPRHPIIAIATSTYAPTKDEPVAVDLANLSFVIVHVGVTASRGNTMFIVRRHVVGQNLLQTSLRRMPWRQPLMNVASFQRNRGG
jgi:hypothetical protein